MILEITEDLIECLTTEKFPGLCSIPCHRPNGLFGLFVSFSKLDQVPGESMKKR